MRLTGAVSNKKSPEITKNSSKLDALAGAAAQERIPREIYHTLARGMPFIKNKTAQQLVMDNAQKPQQSHKQPEAAVDETNAAVERPKAKTKRIWPRLTCVSDGCKNTFLKHKANGETVCFKCRRLARPVTVKRDKHRKALVFLACCGVERRKEHAWPKTEDGLLGNHLCLRHFHELMQVLGLDDDDLTCDTDSDEDNEPSHEL